MGPTDNCGVPQVFEKQYFPASRLNIKWVFVVVVAGEVHPQSQLLVFGKIKRAIFLSWDPLITVVCHRFLRSSIFLLLV